MLNVLHVIGPLSTGGAQTQLLGLIRAAHGRLWNATIVATSGGDLVPEFEALGCPFIELKRWGSPGLLRMKETRRMVGRGSFDVIHGNLWQSNLYCRMAVIGRPNRPAVVISERNVEPDRPWLKRWFDSLLVRATDAYVGNTNAVTDFIREVHPVTDQQVVTIPNAVDKAIFHPRDATREAAGTRIGSVGRLDPEKGFGVLIDAVRLLVNDGHRVELAIAGSGPLLPDLVEQARHLPVSFVGQLPPGRAVAEFLRSLDVFCLPSTFREGRPNAIIEATACGVPVVATRIKGLEELLDRSSLVPPGDPAALALSIEQALHHPDLWLERTRPTPAIGFEDLADRYLMTFQYAVDRASGE